MLSPLLAGLTSIVQFLTKISSHLSPHRKHQVSTKAGKAKRWEPDVQRAFPFVTLVIGVDLLGNVGRNHRKNRDWMDLLSPFCCRDHLVLGSWNFLTWNSGTRQVRHSHSQAIMASFASGRACGRCTIPALRRGAFALETRRSRSISELCSASWRVSWRPPPIFGANAVIYHFNFPVTKPSTNCNKFYQIYSNLSIWHNLTQNHSETVRNLRKILASHAGA